METLDHENEVKCWRWQRNNTTIWKLRSFLTSQRLPLMQEVNFFFILLINLIGGYLLYCGGFYHTLTWFSHGCTRVPHPDPPSHLPPHPIPQGHPSAPALSTLSHAWNLDWRSISHMVIYMFQCYLSNHPILTSSHRVQKSLLYICVSFCLAYRVIITIFLNSIYMY